MRVLGASACAIGARRAHNEDTCFLEVDGAMAIAVVADAMGHARSGLPAADLAVAMAREVFAQRWDLLAETWWEAEHGAPLPPSERAATAAHVGQLRRSRRPATPGDLAALGDGGVAAIAHAAASRGNHAIWSRAMASSRHRGEGTTLEVAVFDESFVAIGHVGDSRSYRVRDGSIRALTRDHSLVNEYLAAMPDLTEEQIADVPQNVITRALGMLETVIVDLSVHALEPGDRFLLCTDGLWSLRSDEELLASVERHGVDAARALVEAAAPHAADNLTALVVEIVQGKPGDPPRDVGSDVRGLSASGRSRE